MTSDFMGERTMPETIPDGPMRVGLRPRLLAAVWFGCTACIPIVFFFGVLGPGLYFGPSALLEAPIVSVFVGLPICMAAFFGFTIGSQILDEQRVTHNGIAALLGILVAVASYLGMMIGYVLLAGLSNPRYDPFELVITFLYVAVFGAIVVGWTIVIAGAVSGLILLNSYNASSISWVTREAARRLNVWAVVALLIAMFLCWLPWQIHAARERSGRQNGMQSMAKGVADDWLDAVNLLIDRAAMTPSFDC